MKRALRLFLCGLSLTVPLAPMAHPRLAFAQQRPAGAAAAQATTTPGSSSGNVAGNVAGNVPEALTEDQAKAQQHFQRAKELYQGGAYRDAITELELARSLDPEAKDLAFNLGIVHERLGKYDEAIGYFRQYIDMPTVTAAERTKAETIIKRIEGAKREAKPAEASATTQTPPPSTDPATPAAKPAHGRVDAATIAAASVAVVGLGVGTIFGIRALSLDTSNFVTGRDGTYQDLQKQTDDAHTSAIVADVGLGVGVLAAAAAAYLYFGRTKEPNESAPASPSTTTARTARVSAGALPGGGWLVIGGAFQ